MGSKSKIEWTDATWNPVTGCTPISGGCKNCYAKFIANRFWGDRKFSDIQIHKDRLEQPFMWKKPRKVFVCSMGDLFHEKVKDHEINSVFLRMMKYDWHIYILLTKRPERMKDFVSIGTGWRGKMDHVWLGVTAENQEMADKRIPILLKIPASVRFVSVEPMLEPIDLSPWLPKKDCYWCPEGNDCNECHPARMKKMDSNPNAIDWVICGAESGTGGKPLRPARMKWIENLMRQCVEAGVPFFLKQMEVEGKLVKMPEIDGRVWDQKPNQ